MPADFASESYKLHIDKTGSNVEELPSLIKDPGLIDAWRHQRMHDFLAPIHKAHADATWMTVGDTGSDAHYLTSVGVRDVTSTCITTKKLDGLKQIGLLEGIAVEEVNAEAIAKDDNSIDIVFCKEAYHHFPRPPVAFYEFLRVCRKMAVYIEPAEQTRWGLFDFLRSVAKQLLRSQSKEQQLFEPSGNFLFRLSEAEFTKMATAMQIDSVAYRYFNDFFYRKVAFRPTSASVPMAIQKLGIMVQDVLSKVGLMNPGLIVYVVFKQDPGDELKAALRRTGFTIKPVPRNPYL